jgi:hypothetical protein
MHVAALMMEGLHRAVLKVKHLARGEDQTFGDIANLFLLFESLLTQKHPQLDTH